MPNQPPISQSLNLPVSQSPDLSPRQLLAITALATGKRNHEAAAIANVTAPTINRWLQLPQFRAALNQELRDAAQQASLRSTHAADRALDILTHIIESDADPATKIKAARVILQNHQPPPRTLPHSSELTPPLALAGFANDLFRSLTNNAVASNNAVAGL